MNNNSFLQSAEWTEFQKSLGRNIFRVENKLVIKHSLALGLNYFYCPRAYFKEESTFHSFIREINKIGKKENCIFLRLEPNIDENIDLEKSLKIENLKFRLVKSVQPQNTLIMDLHHTEETLLANMHPKTRYNIRLAEKHHIEIEKTTNPEDIKIFYNLALKTSARDGFSYHPKDYYEKMLSILGKNKMIELFTSYTDKVPTAAILVLYYENKAIYLHGASDHTHRNLMSPYLLQWEAIKEAKKRGCTTYDFWGIAPKPTSNNQLSAFDEDHPWAGITRFKMGFAPNGTIIHYPDCLEIPLNTNVYWIYKNIKAIMK